MSEWVPDIERLRKFDDGEWLAVERHYCGRLLAYVSRRVADSQAQEDIVQEAFLGAVRGIESFDPLFTFEQYLFGICRNRTIDYLRRHRPQVIQPASDDSQVPSWDSLVRDDETPSRIIRDQDLSRKARELLIQILRDWVQETWQQGEFVRLMVIEALFLGGWRNRDTWRRFKLRDETAVAGIKFRALKRLRELALQRDPSGNLLPTLAETTSQGEQTFDFDVSQAWREGRVSCAARYWLARKVSGSLPEGPKHFLEFHLKEMKCEWCEANQDDLVQVQETDKLDVLLDRVNASTMNYLRSRTIAGDE